ncbi:hypothetical protein Y1Q_0011708 [Alligator mississippiensis]|uniref:Uncharacterized protein n=1 Tax=Alligator mississippiensis TaxID=8496 RepID=A0A151M0T7_ALLMI|nr:hypothetical protein Y1Q_0011708 [Alligator mississippiensis]
MASWVRSGPWNHWTWPVDMGLQWHLTVRVFGYRPRAAGYKCHPHATVETSIGIHRVLMAGSYRLPTHPLLSQSHNFQPVGLSHIASCSATHPQSLAYPFGSGKTCSFTLPSLQRLAYWKLKKCGDTIRRRECNLKWDPMNWRRRVGGGFGGGF